MMAFDSQSTKPSSSMAGTMPFGLIAPYPGKSAKSVAPFKSLWRRSRPSSWQVHKTFRTLLEAAWPYTVSMTFSIAEHLSLYDKHDFIQTEAAQRIRSLSGVWMTPLADRCARGSGGAIYHYRQAPGVEGFFLPTYRPTYAYARTHT